MNLTSEQLRYLESKLKGFPRTNLPRGLELCEDEIQVVVRVFYGKSACEYRMPHSLVWEWGGFINAVDCALRLMSEAARANPNEKVSLEQEDGRLFAIYYRGDKIHNLMAESWTDATLYAQRLGFELSWEQ